MAMPTHNLDANPNRTYVMAYPDDTSLLYGGNAWRNQGWYTRAVTDVMQEFKNHYLTTAQPFIDKLKSYGLKFTGKIKGYGVVDTLENRAIAGVAHDEATGNKFLVVSANFRKTVEAMGRSLGLGYERMKAYAFNHELVHMFGVKKERALEALSVRAYTELAREALAQGKTALAKTYATFAALCKQRYHDVEHNYGTLDAFTASQDSRAKGRSAKEGARATAQGLEALLKEEGDSEGESEDGEASEGAESTGESGGGDGGE